MQETRADALKGEWRRYSQPPGLCRYDLVLYPEQLCDSDILAWREADVGFDYGRNGELSGRWEYDDAIAALRDNDVPQKQNQFKAFQIRRSFF